MPVFYDFHQYGTTLLIQRLDAKVINDEQILPPDDVNNGFLHSSNAVPADMNLPPATTPTSTLRWGAINAMDAQPDVFYFNFGKYSRKFIFDKAGNHARQMREDKVSYKMNVKNKTLSPPTTGRFR